MSAFVLKIIACVTMLIDHIGVAYGIGYFRIIGRMAFPIYAFLISRGCTYTRNLRKYVFRLGIFALISEIPFDMLLNANVRYPKLVFIDMSHQNVFFTLFLGALSILIYKEVFNKCKNKDGNINYNHIISYTVVMFLILVFSEFINSDYSIIGIILIFCCYFFKRPFIALLLFSFINYTPINYTPMFIGSIGSVVLIYFYNGNKGSNVKWLFYIFYPLHMIVLSLSIFIVNYIK